MLTYTTHKQIEEGAKKGNEINETLFKELYN